MPCRTSTSPSVRRATERGCRPRVPSSVPELRRQPHLANRLFKCLAGQPRETKPAASIGPPAVDLDGLDVPNAAIQKSASLLPRDMMNFGIGTLEHAEHDRADKGECEIRGQNAQLTDERTKGHFLLRGADAHVANRT